MANPANHKMIRVPVQLAERIERLQDEIYLSYVEGRTDRPNITEQGGASWVSKSEVIRLALDEMEDHKKRSRKARKRK